MDENDLSLRNLTYRLFVDLGRAPTVEELASRAGVAREEALGTWRRLAVEHAIVLQDDGVSLRMANPFSAVPTPYRVEAAGRHWFANCAWDAFGICAALHADGRISTTCPDCGDAIDIDVRDQRPTHDSVVFHCLVRAAEWWDDIGFT